MFRVVEAIVDAVAEIIDGMLGFVARLVPQIFQDGVSRLAEPEAGVQIQGLVQVLRPARIAVADRPVGEVFCQCRLQHRPLDRVRGGLENVIGHGGRASIGRRS